MIPIWGPAINIVQWILRTDADFKITNRRKTNTKDLGPRTKDHGPCFGTNEHPRRDTDVILRLSILIWGSSGDVLDIEHQFFVIEKSKSCETPIFF